VPAEGGGTQAPPPGTTPAPAAGTVEPPAPVAPKEPAPFASPAEQAAAENRLAKFLEEHDAEVKRLAQSEADKRYNGLQEEMKKDREVRLAHEKELREQVRTLQLNGLQPEEQERLKKAWEQDDRTADLDLREQANEDWTRKLVIAQALQESGQFGVEEGDLQGLTPEEVQIFCAEAKAAYYEEKAKGGAAPTAPAASAAPAPAPAVPAPQGAHTPSDVGGGGGSAPPVKFNTEMGEDAMRENLAAMPWQSVPVPRK
jgi:hypothetical protein